MSSCRSEFYEKLELDLGEERDGNDPTKIQGEGLIVRDISEGATLTVKIDDSASGEIPLDYHGGYRQIGVNFTKLFFTNTAQSGKSVEIWILRKGFKLFLYQITKVRGLYWYDRNPTVVHKKCSLLGLAPHGDAERWIYVVPEGRMAYAEVIFIHTMRYTVADAVGRAKTNIFYKAKGESAEAIITAEIVTNGVGDKDRVIIGHSFLLLAGDEISCHTSDTSTGGSVAYRGNAKFTEFDV